MVKPMTSVTPSIFFAMAAAALFGASTPLAKLPALTTTAQIMSLGLFGYGVSLVLFVLALRGLGAARTGAYFSTAPVIGAIVAIAVLNVSTSPAFWIACGLMSVGVWLHLTDEHVHDHTHEAMLHDHSHSHDAHHQHEHLFAWDGVGAHTHEHQHVVVTHKHPHFPDVHHRHKH